MAIKPCAWQPTTEYKTLVARAQLLRDIREYFHTHKVLEVETPLLAKHTVSAPHLASFKVQQGGYYLQTSPEYAMKRLLAAGSGDIFQICKAFRQAERGSQHNSEFTLAEWYRLGFSAQQLIADVSELLSLVLGDLDIEILSYRDAFLRYADIDPFAACLEALQQAAQQYIEFDFVTADRDDYLDLILSHCVQPQLACGQHVQQSTHNQRKVCFLIDFPASQAALAAIKQTDYGAVAQRFEVFIQGLEIANAYVELSDPQQLAQRWEQDNIQREYLGLGEIDADAYLLAAQAHGLPACAGVALGVDRLLMCQLGLEQIDQVIAFTDERA